MATLLVGVALLLGIGVFANVLFRVLANQLQASAISQAGLVARAVADRGPASVRGTDVTSAFDVQVVDPYGNVAYTTSDSTPLAALRPLPGEVLAEGGGGWWWPFVAEEAPIVAAQGVEYDGAPWSVLVATPLGRPHETVSTARCCTRAPERWCRPGRRSRRSWTTSGPPSTRRGTASGSRAAWSGCTRPGPARDGSGRRSSAPAR